ncbi:MAG: reverse transcriptase domain-containing protein, partial [Chromatiales bacterium]
ELAQELAPILTYIFRRSLALGEVPSDWCIAHVTPIYKKGQKYEAENYRPVSLTSIVCKLMEHVLVSNLMKHAEENNSFYPLQRGFRQGLSCETQLLEFLDHLTDILIMSVIVV